MDLLRDFGAAVRIHRQALGISQEELAHRAGVDRTYMSGIERGVRNPSLKSINRVASALEVDLVTLFRTMRELADEGEKGRRS
jgi:transcriptional regulator with XRE-family HTH domain